MSSKIRKNQKVETNESLIVTDHKAIQKMVQDSLKAKAAKTEKKAQTRRAKIEKLELEIETIKKEFFTVAELVAIRDQLKRKVRELHKAILENPVSSNTAHYPTFKMAVHISLAADYLVFENRNFTLTNSTKAERDHMLWVGERMNVYMKDITAAVKKVRNEMFKLKKKVEAANAAQKG